MLRFFWRRFRRHVLSMEELAEQPDLTVIEAKLMLDLVEQQARMKSTPVPRPTLKGI